MEDVDLILSENELASQLDGYRFNHFSNDIRKYLSSNKNQNSENLTPELDCILSAKNEWEACVDSLEHMAVIILDHNLRVIRTNRTIELWGWEDVDKVKGVHILNLIKPIVDENTENYWCQINMQENVEWELEHESTNKKYRFSFYPNRNIESVYHSDNCSAVLLICEVTEKNPLQTNKYVFDRRLNDSLDYKKHNKRIADADKRIHDLSEQLINSNETERKRVSSELHDGVGQALSALKYQVESIIRESKKTSQQRKNDGDLKDVLVNIKGALGDLKRISVDLRPSVLDDLGLLMSIRWFCREYKKVYTKINIDLQLDVQESKVSDIITSTIYRIIQETLHNIAKHADASNVLLQLTLSDNGLLLRISDDGCGFDLVKTKQNIKSGLGLQNMEERALKTGAKFTMISNSFSGTVVQVFWSGIYS